ncbi:rRNA methyltransferase [Opitutaceae bacterium EW11]|nr:rRNA methyltransferase [Opitutaceae bacterium EW11]
MLFRCQPGFESSLVAELGSAGFASLEQGSGWVRTGGTPTTEGTTDSRLGELCFPHAILLTPVEVTGDSVNGLAEKVAQVFLDSARQERFEAPWPFLVDTAGNTEGLGRRADGVARAALELLKKRMGRVAKLASDQRPAGPGERRGLFVYFADFQRAFVSRSCVFGGQRRMADDPQAPSRSYLKIEEAYGILGREPSPDERVVDLGAAPGGWSYSAAKRGAHVVAVDNGPLKAGAANNPNIEHRRADAFSFFPPAGEAYDWMFCDLLEEPHHVMRNLLEPWLERAACRRFVVILKFGRANPVALLEELRSPKAVLGRCARNVRIRHLFHNREEFTITGEVVP